jgi:hypothetical protein
MPSLLTAGRSRRPFVILLVGFGCAQAACSLGSLDYLQNGAKREVGSGDGQGTSTRDGENSNDEVSATKPDGGGPDATSIEVTPGSDGSRDDSGSDDVFTNDPIPDAQVERGSDLGADAFGPDTKNPDGAPPDTKDAGGVVPDSFSNLDAIKRDGLISPDSPPDVYVAGPEVAPDGPTSKASVLFVVGAIPLSTADTAIQNHLVAKGYDVTPFRDNATVVGAITQTLVFISRSVGSANVGTKYRSVAKPVLVNEYNLFASDMGLVSGNSGTAGSSATDSLDVQASAGALAAGLSGTINVFSAAQDTTYGVPTASAILVAALPGQTTKWPIFAYETGAQMSGIVAPARRMGFFLSGTDAPSLTANGWLLFDAAIAWLAKSG